MVAILTLSAGAAPPRSAPPDPGAITFYVATTGSDSWSGRLAAPNHDRTDGPFASLARARDAIRQLKEREGGLQQPVTVLLRRGTYFLSEPLILTSNDSGTARCPITYAAFHNEPVVLSGGRRITGWHPVTLAGKHLWAAPVPEAREGKWAFHQLWIHGERRTLARSPNKGYLHVAEIPSVTAQTEWTHGQTSFHFHPGDLSAKQAAPGAEVIVMNRWVESHLPVTGIDEADHLVTFGKRSVFKLDPGDPYFIQNSSELLDAPGEWYLDRQAGTLYYLPQPGEAVEKEEAIAPLLSQLLRLEGKPEADQWVEHVLFRGLTFSHTEWRLPEAARTQTAEPPAGGFEQAAIGVPGALYGDGVRDCRWEHCTVAHVGSYGIELARGCSRNQIAGCHLFDLGAGGVKIGETTIRHQEAEQTHGNTVSGCHIHHGGRIFPSAVGLWVGQSFGNRIFRNHLHDFYYTGFSVGWTWGYGETLAGSNLIEGNEVDHIGCLSDGDGPILSDMGAIYTLGMQPGTVIRGNRFHDIAGLRYGGWGIYLDEGSSSILAENNLVYRTTHGGFHQHYGRENIIRNNIFAFGRDAQLQRTRTEPHLSFTFERNIVYWKEGALLAGDFSDTAEGHFAFDHNLYWRAGGGEIRFGDLTWQEWRQHGTDQHSLIADPQFAAPDKDDFRLEPGSPASTLGFVPFP